MVTILCPNCRGKGVVVTPEKGIYPNIVKGSVDKCPECKGTGITDKKTREK